MTKFLRYKDLKARGTFNSRMTLHRAIKSGAFSSGRLLTPNARAWTEAEVIEYENSRPTKREAKKSDDNATDETDDGADEIDASTAANEEAA